MCRSIKTFREPYTEQVTEGDVRAAALQYVRKISGFRAPAAQTPRRSTPRSMSVARATADLLARLEVRGGRLKTRRKAKPRARLAAFRLAAPPVRSH